MISITQLIIVFLTISSFKCTSKSLNDIDNSGNQSIVGFWNIYAEGSHYLDIVLEQKRVLESSGLLSKLDTLYFTTMGAHINELISSIQSNKIKHLTHFGNTGPEYLTLNEVYKFCHANPNSKILYFHNKGSLNYDILNINLRRALDCFVLNPSCISALDTYDTCGWRLSPLPHVHYSGNYWWSNCKHINKLIDPLAPIHNQTFLTLTSTIYASNKKTTELPTSTNLFPDQPYLGR